MPCIAGTARRSAWLKGKLGEATGGHTGHRSVQGSPAWPLRWEVVQH